MKKNKIRIAGKVFSAEEILAAQHVYFFAQSPLHQQLLLFLREWFSPEKTISLQTSGSTGSPKRIIVRKEQMVQSARMTCDFFQLKENDKALLCLPLDYIAGKMMVVRAICGGLDLYPVTPSGHPLAGTTTAFDFAAMVPLQVYNTLQSPEDKKRFSQIKRVIIGGGAVDPQLEEALRDFPNDIYSTYGMTETVSHIALRKINGAGAEKGYTPLRGVSLELSDEQTLIIHAPHVANETLVTNDIAEIHTDGTFRILGRKDNVINTGGIKVQAEEVERIIRPCIKGNLAITAVPHPRLGEAVVLLIEPLNNPGILKREVKKLLPRHQQPLHIFVVENIPQTGSGKTNRVAAKKLAMQKATLPDSSSCH
jgi:O-succinylbenzoic acid--CoA ligase